MSAEHYIKTLCPFCDGSIEFPANTFGEKANCPHCQNLIELGKPSESVIGLPPLPKKANPPSNLKRQIAIALCALIFICAESLCIYQDLKTQKANHAEQPAAQISADAYLGLPPTTPNSNTDPFADMPNAPTKNANGTPLGAWAATLVPVTTEENLFRDPVTYKLYRIKNGEIVEENNPYAGLTLEQTKLLIQLQSETANKQTPIADTPIAPLPILSYSVPVSAPETYVSPPIVTPVVTSYDPDSLANPYGAGSPYKADGLMNPYSRYGSPYSSQSWRNPYATDTPKLYDSTGNYRGKLSSNPYDSDSTANPYGKYGSPYSPDSINNPYGLGSPYNTKPIYVVPSP